MLPEVVVEIIPSRSLEGTGVVDQDVDVSQLIGDPVAGGFDRRPVADVEPHRNRLGWPDLLWDAALARAGSVARCGSAARR
jgi:hypothetical protein